MTSKSSPVEEEYRESLRNALKEIEAIGTADIVVGIPFWKEMDTIAGLLLTVEDGLRKYYPDNKCVVVCVGDAAGSTTLEVIRGLPREGNISRISFLMNSKKVSGKGWSLRAIMEIASLLRSDIAIFEADLISRKSSNSGNKGMSPDWVHRILSPIRNDDYGLAVSRFNRHSFEVPTARHLAYPLIAGVYGVKIHDPLGIEFAMSRSSLDLCLNSPGAWFSETRGLGTDLWMVTCAITGDVKICEVDMGVRLHKSSPGKMEVSLREVAKTLFECIVLHSDWWQERGHILRTVDEIVDTERRGPIESRLNSIWLMARYRKGFNRYDHTVCERILPPDLCKTLEALAETDDEKFSLNTETWARTVYHFACAFNFASDIDKEDLLSAFVPIYDGRLASFANQVRFLESRLSRIPHDEAKPIVQSQAEGWIEDQVSEFVRQRSEFMTRWTEKEEAFLPMLPNVTCREFVPGVALIMPHEITAPNGEIARVDVVHREIVGHLKEGFEHFVHGTLGVPYGADTREVVYEVKHFMRDLEVDLDEALLSGDVTMQDGVDSIVDAVFSRLPYEQGYMLQPDVISWLLRRYPPSNLLLKLGPITLSKLEKVYAPNDILALAGLSEEMEHRARIWAWIRSNARPDHFTLDSLKPLVVDYDRFPLLLESRGVSEVDMLSGRIMVTNLPKGVGGEFPKTRYLTLVCKNIVEGERFGEMWRIFAEEKKEFGRKVINSIEGHWGREPLSAHNIFEDKNQRILVERLRMMVQDMVHHEKFKHLASMLKHATDCYHIAWTTTGGKFIPCSCWSWSSYSARGGRGVPTPLSVHVERDWASREFLLRLFEVIGGDENRLDGKIVELMGQGRESEDLSYIVLPLGRETTKVLPAQPLAMEQPEAGVLSRVKENPILQPISDHTWESKYVLNCGAVIIKGITYLLYRAYGEDSISRIGLAESSDGIHISERLPYPVYGPAVEEESKGCEDPRIVVIDNRVYMLYTAFSHIAAQIAIASIDIGDFLNHRWDRWERHGQPFPGYADKDAVLFPEKFNGKYVMYHRIEPSVWISYSETIDAPWSRKGHKILTGPRSGVTWDGVKVGAGAQPLKTKYGWLLIYHGVDFAHVYRLGVMVVDLNDPAKIIYRSPNAILEPLATYEVGEHGKSWIPNVVFTCGAVARQDKELLDVGDEIIVYYGAADTVICAATAKVGDLIPEEIRMKTGVDIIGEAIMPTSP
ncbi:MAG: glycosidase [Chloroflexota bacterium]|nr:glycosidase [Chloroflexota bacterium]